MKKAFSIFTLLVASPVTAQAACDIESIGTRLSQDRTLFDFRQSKTIGGLSRPLLSSGIIWMSQQRELVWQVHSPIKSTTVISNEEVREYNRNDVLQPQISNPIAEEIPAIFLNLLSGDFNALESSFEQSLSCDEEDWSLQLTPYDPAIGELLSEITISGTQILQQVNYLETRGDLTEIILTPSEDAEPEFGQYLED